MSRVLFSNPWKLESDSFKIRVQLSFFFLLLSMLQSKEAKLFISCLRK